MGLKPDEFWNLTISEFSIMIEGHCRKQKNRIDELLFTAWHTAAFIRAEKLPSLQSILQQTDPHKHGQTDDEMLAMAKILNAAFGGEVVEA